ncbi:MAG: hypothetical protein WAK00_02125 [Microbacterium sp.]|uniref:hypothetical protein n=1 Tax=Microbacterium sp. TaxID=51671 RepID=UPI003BAF7377
MLRPGGGHDETVWKSQVLSELVDSDAFTFPRPVGDDRGAWVRDGWHAMEWIPGTADPQRVEDVIRAAVIDWAPYWRPRGFGAAVAVADAVCWHGYPLSRLAEDRGIPQWRQLLLRALAFRMATLHLRGV